MIDTIKIVSMINLHIYNAIKSSSIIKTSYHSATGEIFYTIINDSIEGSYSSSLSVRVGEGSKYKFTNMYYIEIEGSYHKLIRGFNSHNGFYNLVFITKELIKMVESAYKVVLPTIRHWFIQRVDIAICYDLKNQENIKAYINNLNCCNYPRRKLKHYEEESIYLTGSTTTLKIYNKLKEFKKHDIKKFKNTDFNIIEYLETIKGFIRFECEIKKRKLTNFYNKKYIRVYSISYNDLKNIWYEEFSKFLKILKSDLNIVNERTLIKERLFTMYKKTRAKNLFNFYLLTSIQGLQEMRRCTNRSMYYKNISDLKKANIDFSQKLDVDLTNSIINFNPFKEKEIF